MTPALTAYNALRDNICREGLIDETAGLVEELRSLVDFPMEILQRTASDELRAIYDSEGLVGAYSALDNGYRNGVFEPREVNARQRAHVASGLVGFVGYFVPRVPYYLCKGIAEHYVSRDLVEKS